MMITAGLIHLKNNPQAFGKTADGEDHMIDRNTQVKIEFSGTIRSVSRVPMYGATGWITVPIV